MPVTVINATPRLFARHVRHRAFARVNHSQQELAFLETQANRLTTTVAIVFGKLNKYTADQIAGAVNLAAIP